MGAGKNGPKVEARSRTGAGYTRAGHRWTPEFSDVPEALLRDDAAMDRLVADAHLEVRVDGKYLSGPRANAGQGSEPKADADGHARALQREVERLDARHDEMRAMLDKSAEALATAASERDAARAEAAALKAELEALKAAASPKPTEPSTPAAKADDAGKAKSSKA